MASNGHRRPRNRTLILAVIAFILSAVFLTYMRLDPISLAMSPHPTPNDTDGDAEVIEKSKHDKGDPKRTYPQVSTLPASHLPTNTPTPRRLMVIGDVHGHLKSLEALLRKAEFSASRGDTVIFAGDMVNKGPDSAGVVEHAIRIGAFGVRGNHEDRVLRAWEYLEDKKRAKGKGVGSNSNSDNDEGEEEDENGTITDTKDAEGEESEGIQNSGLEEGSEGEEEDEEDDSRSTAHDKKHKEKKGKKKKGKKKGHKHKIHHKDLVTAKSLKPEHVAWLSRLPLILRIGNLGRPYGEVLVVHAGLVPGIPLESQDPEAVMTMRTILLSPSYDPFPNFNPNSDPSENDNQAPLTATTITDKTEDQPQSDEIEEAKSKDQKHHPRKMIPSASRKGIPWAEVWTSWQQTYFSPPIPSFSPSRLRPPIAPATVVYGHDAKAGLQMREYAFGVDSGCGNGKKLTGVMFEFGGKKTHEIEGEEEERGEDNNGKDAEEEDRQSQGHKARIRHRLVSVSCVEGH